MYHTVHDCAISHLSHHSSQASVQQKQKYSQSLSTAFLLICWFEHTTRPFSGSSIYRCSFVTRSPLGYHARVCDLVSQIISSYSTSLQHSPHSKNALRILLKLPLRLTLASLSLCSAHPASHSSAQHASLVASPRLIPFFFSHPPSHLISHLCSTSTSGAHTQTLCGSMSPYLFWRIRRAVPGSGVCGHISGVIKKLLPSSQVQPPCEFEGAAAYTLTCTLSSSDHITSAPITQSPRRGTSPPHNRVFRTECRSVSLGRFTQKLTESFTVKRLSHTTVGSHARHTSHSHPGSPQSQGPTNKQKVAVGSNLCLPPTRCRLRGPADLLLKTSNLFADGHCVKHHSSSDHLLHVVDVE